MAARGAVAAMKGRLRLLLAGVAIVLLIVATALGAALLSLTGQRPAELLTELRAEAVVQLYALGVADELPAAAVTRLYRGSCTRRCHGRDVIEARPRTAAEWEAVMTRMKATDRAALGERLAETLTRYLQTHYLSNVPTVLPGPTMRFVKQHLWRSDFGEKDLFFDLIYLPHGHESLLRYLGVREPWPDLRQATFVVFMNTHRGTLPQLDLGQISTMRLTGGRTIGARGWSVLYRDGQQHHRQGLLTFSDVATAGSSELEVAVQLPGLGTRTFRWRLPIPPLQE